MKKLTAFIISAILILASVTVLAETHSTVDLYLNRVKLTVNGQTTNTPTLLYQGRAYIQLRAAADTFGARLDWNGSNNTASLTTNINAELVVNSGAPSPESQVKAEVYFDRVKLVVNGQMTSTPTLLFSSRTYLQLKSLADVFGAELKWDGDKNIAALYTRRAVSLITGYAMDSSRNIAIPNAQVRLTAADGRVIQTVKADSSGAYLFKNVAAGMYNIEASAENYFDGSTGTFTVGGGAAYSKDVYLAYLIASTVEGYVKDLSTNSAVGGANIKLIKSPGAQLVQTIVSAANGYFAFKNVPLGTYKLEVSAAGYATVTMRDFTVIGPGSINMDVNLSGSAPLPQYTLAGSYCASVITETTFVTFELSGGGNDTYELDGILRETSYNPGIGSTDTYFISGTITFVNGTGTARLSISRRSDPNDSGYADITVTVTVTGNIPALTVTASGFKDNKLSGTYIKVPLSLK